MCLPHKTYWETVNPMQSHLNIGTGTDLSIAELAETIRQVVGYKGKICFNPEFPDGTPRKLLDVSALKALGWQPRIELADGIASVYQWFKTNCNSVTATGH